MGFLQFDGHTTQIPPLQMDVCRLAMLVATLFPECTIHSDGLVSPSSHLSHARMVRLGPYSLFCLGRTSVRFPKSLGYRGLAQKPPQRKICHRHFCPVAFHRQFWHLHWQVSAVEQLGYPYLTLSAIV